MPPRLPPFASLSKEAVLGRLRAEGSHDPDVLEEERARLLRAGRGSGLAGAALVLTGAGLALSPLGVSAGLPCLLASAWLFRRGRRHAVAVRDGFAAFGNSESREPA